MFVVLLSSFLVHIQCLAMQLSVFFIPLHLHSFLLLSVGLLLLQHFSHFLLLFLFLLQLLYLLLIVSLILVFLNLQSSESFLLFFFFLLQLALFSLSE